MTPIAVLISGTGRLLQELIDRSQAGELPVKIALVISSSPSAYGLERAAQAGIPTAVVSTRTEGSEARRDEKICLLLERCGAQAVVLAGYLAYFRYPQQLTNRVLNIHPALLPGFGGKGLWGHHVHEAVLKSGVKVSGCTVHLVDEHYDHGPIVLQRTCPVLDDDTPDTLAARVFQEERLALPQAVRLLVEKRLVVEGRRVKQLPAQ